MKLTINTPHKAALHLHTEERQDIQTKQPIQYISIVHPKINALCAR